MDINRLNIICDHIHLQCAMWYFYFDSSHLLDIVVLIAIFLTLIELFDHHISLIQNSFCYTPGKLNFNHQFTSIHCRSNKSSFRS